jgi:hypothetical protein
MVALKKKSFAVKLLTSQRGVALMGIIVAVSLVIAFLLINGVKYANQTGNTRGQSRRQVFAQEIFQNAAVVVLKAYETAKAGGCPPNTVLRTTTGGPMSTAGLNLCLPDPTNLSNCLSNPENTNNFICLDTALIGNGVLTFAPLPDKRGSVARLMEKIDGFADRVSLVSGFSKAEADVSHLPPMPPFTSYTWTFGTSPTSVTCAATPVSASNCLAGVYNALFNTLPGALTISAVSPIGAFTGTVNVFGNWIEPISGNCTGGNIAFTLPFYAENYTGTYTPTAAMAGTFSYLGTPYAWNAQLPGAPPVQSNCVNIRICLQAGNCPLTSATTTDLNYYQTIAFPP